MEDKFYYELDLNSRLWCPDHVVSNYVYDSKFSPVSRDRRMPLARPGPQIPAQEGARAPVGGPSQFVVSRNHNSWAKEFRLWWSGKQTSRSDEAHAAVALSFLDEGDVPVGVINAQMQENKRFGAMRMAVKYAEMAKTELILERTEADRQTVRLFIFRQARQHNMRHTDIKKFIDLAVALSFVPDQHELDAVNFNSTARVIDRVADATEIVHTRERGWFRKFWRKPTTARPFTRA